MKCAGDGNGGNPLGLGPLNLSVHLAAFLILILWSLTVRSVAIAGNLDRVASFDIKAQSLEKALVQFGVQAHVQIVFASKVSMNRLRTVALKGKYTGREALTNLLRGSKYEFIENGSTTEILPSSWAPLGTRGNYGHQTDSTEKEIPPAQKQTDPIGTPDPRKKNSTARHKVSALQEVIVTGTHIRGAPVSSPLIIITREQIDQSGYTTVGDLIQSLPDNFGDSGPQTVIGSTPNSNESASGAPSPDLHGLGGGSTLTLVDGQRLAVDSITGTVDISLIPLPVVDHVDVLTGGASAIYGSDAVAGVVNFVLKRAFDGAKTTVLGGGTANGGGTDRYFNQLLGKTWNTGGAIFDYESEKQDPILASQRDYTESAASLTTTLPATSRSSLFIRAHQNIGAVSAFVTGLYTHRTVRDALSNGPEAPSESEEVGVQQLAADGGVTASLPSQWHLSVVGNFSEERTDFAYTLLAVPPEPIPSDLNEGLTKSLKVTANGPILALPTGMARGALGMGYRIETYNYVLGGVSSTPGARRTVKYAYGEFDVPLLRSSTRAWRRALMLNVSGRFERYSDFGNESVPKVGLVYAPFRSIKVRTTWGRAFRAPPLFQVYSSHGLLYWPLPDPLSPTGVSNVLVTTGGNPQLKPETAETWTAGIDYASKAATGLVASATYFDVAYRNRIGQLENPFAALTDPLNAPFVTRSPPEGYVQSLVSSADYITNLVGTPIDPENVPAVVNFSYVNVASQDVTGGDFGVGYRVASPLGEIQPFINAAFLDLRQRLVPGVVEAEISGMVFEPPKIRARGGVTWGTGQWTATGIVNYSGSETNTYQSNFPKIASWTTVDLHLTWQTENKSAVGGLGVSLSVQNALNRDPPFVQFDQFVPGIHYDPLNANALGRVIRLSASWLIQ